MKTKQYTVTITAFATVIVSSKNEEEAFEAAREAISTGDFECDEYSAKQIPRDMLNSALRHADVVAYDLEKAQGFARSNPLKRIPAIILSSEK